MSVHLVAPRYGTFNTVHFPCVNTTYTVLNINFLHSFDFHRAVLRRVIQNDCRGINNLSYTIHLVLQMQPPCDFFLWVYIKDQVYVPPLPGTEGWYMLQTVWNELDYRVDVCRITKGAHIEHL